MEYLKAALESLEDPDDRAAGLLALRTEAEAYGGLGAVAAEAGISRESLYRALSPKGNPTLKTCSPCSRRWGCGCRPNPKRASTREDVHVRFQSVGNECYFAFGQRRTAGDADRATAA